MASSETNDPVLVRAEDHSFEREKWEAERGFKNRELRLKEQEHDLRVTDLELRRNELEHSKWRNPVFIAVLAAIIAAAGNAYVAWQNGQLGRDLEDRKSEQARIQEMIKTGDPDVAARNLQFLVDAGLITDPARVAALNRYLRTRSPGTGAALPAVSGDGGIIGADDTVPLSTLRDESPLGQLSQSVGRLRVYRANQFEGQCTAIHIGGGDVVVPRFCVKPGADADLQYRLILHEEGRDRTLNANFVRLIGEDAADRNAGAAVVHVPELRQYARGLKLATAAPGMNERLSIILFRKDDPRAIASSPDCAVLAVDETTIRHRCDTGAGAAGAPLLNKSFEVVGLHTSRAVPPQIPMATAIRADRIAAELRTASAPAATPARRPPVGQGLE